MKNVIAVILLISILGIFTLSASALVISVEPSYITVSPGDEFTVNITVDPAGTEVMGAQYWLLFDNILLQGLSQKNGTFLRQDGANTNVYSNETNNTIGRVRYGETRMGVNYGVTSPGTLATITFKAMEQGVSSLNLSKVKLTGPDAQIISNVTVNNGTVETAPQPSSPFLVYGYVFYEDGSVCNNPMVNITNLNTSEEWKAETNESYNYYQLMLRHGIDIVAGEVLQLQFNATSPDGSQSNITNHTISQDDIESGGIFDFNITLESTALRTYNISLSSEWNLISIPLIPENTGLNEILGDKLTGGTSLSDADAVWGWTGTTWETAILIEGTGNPAYDGKWFDTGYQPTAMTIEPDKGYWIHILPGHPNVNITITGAESAGNRTIAVSKGWNLVGSTFLDPVPLNYSGLFESGCTGGTSLSDADAVWGWTGNTWETAILINGTGNPTYDGKWFDTGYQPTKMTLSPGRGYWIHVLDTHDGFTWDYPKTE